MKRTLIIFVLLQLVLGVLAQSNDDAVRITDQMMGFGARALGMGGAFQAVADDYSAIYWNPAGLAQSKKMEFWLGISHFRFANDIIFQGSALQATNSTTKFNSIGFVYPVPTYQGNLVFGFGYQKIKDFEYSNKYLGYSDQGTIPRSNRLSFRGVDPNNPDDIYDFFGEPVQKEGYVTDDGSLNEWSAAGAIDVSPNISVGLGLNYWSGSSDYYDEFIQSDKLNNFSVFPADFAEYEEVRILSSKYSSFTMRLGSLFRLGRLMRLGLGIEIPQKINVKEDYLLDSNLLFDDGYEETFDESDEENSGAYEYNVTIPFRFSGGASLKLRNILLSGSMEYTDWTQLKFEGSELILLPPWIRASNSKVLKSYFQTINFYDSKLTSLNRYFDTEYRETLKMRVGGEYSMPIVASSLRAGFIYEPNPAKGLSKEHDRKYFTLGYGVLIDRTFQLDFAYMLGSWKQKTYGELSPEGTAEDITSHKIILNISIRY